MFSTDKLIELVKKHKILYDFLHVDYKNVKARDEVWVEIGKELNESGSELKRKWRNIRDSYKKYLRSLKIKPAQAARRSYKNWRWAQKMEAFRPYLSLAKTESSEFENNADDPNLTQLPGMSITSMTDNLEEREQSQARPGQATEYQETNIQKKRKNISTKVKESSISSVDDVINYFENKKRRTDDTDATDLIFLGYSSTVKSFSPKRQAIVKMKIAQIIMEEEIEHATEISGLPTCYLHSE